MHLPTNNKDCKPTLLICGILMITLIIINNLQLFFHQYTSKLLITTNLEPASIKCYVLHKSHILNSDLLHRYKRAQYQIESYDTNPKCKYLLLYWIGDRNTSNLTLQEQTNLTLTTSQIGEQNIFIIDANKTDYAFNGFFNVIFNIDATPSPQWLSKSHWAWSMADIPEIVWSYYQFNDENYKTYIDTIDDIYVWVLEYDVVWSGHLGKILINAISNHINCTYLALNVGIRDSYWPNSYMRHPKDFNTLYDASRSYNIYAAMIQLVRYRPKLLLLMREQIRNRKYIYCEMRAIMICKYLMNNSCSYASFDNATLNFTQYFGYFSWEKPNHATMDAIIEEIKLNSTNKVYHPVKQANIYNSRG